MSRGGDLSDKKRVAHYFRVLAPSSAKSRKWSSQAVKYGSMVIKKWIPERREMTQELQDHRNALNALNDKKKTKTARKSSVKNK